MQQLFPVAGRPVHTHVGKAQFAFLLYRKEKSALYICWKGAIFTIWVSRALVCNIHLWERRTQI